MQIALSVHDATPSVVSQLSPTAPGPLGRHSYVSGAASQHVWPLSHWVGSSLHAVCVRQATGMATAATATAENASEKNFE